MEEHLLAVGEASQVGEVRRLARTLAERLEFDDETAGRAAIVAAELATNLVKHARGGGHTMVRALVCDGTAGVELIALDQGPGMRDPGAAIRDGFSTAGTRGTGLGAVMRLSSEWDIHSTPGLGTGVLARIWKAPRPHAAEHATAIGGVRVPAPGETVCGDAWAVRVSPQRIAFAVADGLGHGEGAAVASGAAMDGFARNAARPPAQVLEALHRALHATRGAAVAAGEVDLGTMTLSYAGVGNVAGSMLVGIDVSQGLVSQPGTVGHELRRIQEMSYAVPDGAVIIVHSDGVSSRWDPARYPGLIARDPALIAAVLWRDFGRGRDDATVLVLRVRRPVLPEAA